ncbi:MAG: hypothetical protein ABI237_03235 [Ginsengibacter sp.]
MKKNMIFRSALVILFATLSLGSNAQETQHQKVNIIDFQVVKDQNKVLINWATDNGVPTNYFMVEKSSDGKNFRTVAYVMGPDPTRRNCDCYDCFDKVNTNTKKSYYRLRHVDNDGKIELSEVRILALK